MRALVRTVIFAFRSTFSIKYFQHAHGLDLAAAGAINAWVFMAAIFATPPFGWLCDRTGRYAPMLAFGALMLPVSIAIMSLSHGSLWVGTVLIGISFSLVPAVMWPLTAKLVPEANFGTALGLMWVDAECRHCRRKSRGGLAERQLRRERADDPATSQ